jgi:hypothetical protein
MLPKSVKKRLPTRHDVQKNKYLQFLGRHLHSPNLWHFNRRSVARATAIGLFCAYLPIPFEMVPAAIGAIVWRANMPLSLAWVWISNPLTWIPLWGPAYLIGAWLLDRPAVPLDELTLEIFTEYYTALWLGCLIFGLIVGTAGYYLVSMIWRSKVVRMWRRRREIRKIRKKKAAMALNSEVPHPGPYPNPLPEGEGDKTLSNQKEN